jgi:heterodisulfide reductase subunit A
MQKEKSVLVIGAGIAGSAAALNLARSGAKVYLAEKQEIIGGWAGQMGCKATDECVRCNVCLANEILRDTGLSRDIDIHTCTEVVETSENKNGYTVTLKSKPKFINSEKCITCRKCVKFCPEKCITIPKFAIPPIVPVIEYSKCRRYAGKECDICEKICPVVAIDMNEKEKTFDVTVDNIIIATGYSPYNPKENTAYNFGRVKNIVTGMEAEQQLGTSSKLVRPSDNTEPKRIAFIQCVGSRTEEIFRRPEDTNYCSAVCCSYALRMASKVKNKNPNAEVTVFYMDIQKFGKNFDEYFDKCKKEMSFIRSRPYEVKQGEGDTVVVKFADEGAGKNASVSEKEFDLLILSVGIRPQSDAEQVSDVTGAAADEQGFFGLKSAGSICDLQKKGVFAVGACENPKDIQATIAQSQAVCEKILSE